MKPAFPGSRYLALRASGALPYALLAFAFWVVRYWHFAGFGLYEDDLTHLPIAAAMGVGEVLQFAFDPSRFVNLYGGGHPLHYTFIYLFTNLGWRLWDIRGLYVVGFAIEIVNIALFYRLLSKVHSPRLGMLGGLAYVLFSADTTQAYLTLSLGLQPSISFLLLGSLAYLSGRRWLTYLVAPFILLTYETFFPVLFAVPLLSESPERGRIRELTRHGVILALILASMSIWRYAVGDDRVQSLTVGTAASLAFVHILQGSIVSLGTYLYRPIQGLVGADSEFWVAFSASAVFSFALIHGWAKGTAPHVTEGIRSLTSGSGRAIDRLKAIGRIWPSLPQEVRSLTRIAGAGAAMVALAYPLTFTVRAYAISGRDTRVHAAAVVGAAILLGCLLLLLLWFAAAFRRALAVSGVVGIWVGLMVGFGFQVQRDYRMAWQYQQEFWSQLIWLVPDVGEGGAILVDPVGLKDPRHIGANYWNLPVVLEQLYVFPDDWYPPPWVYRMTEDWQTEIVTDDGQVRLDSTTVFAPPSTFQIVAPTSTILIEITEGGLQRRGGPMELGGQTIHLKPLPPGKGEPPYAHGFLYRYLVQTDSLPP